MDVQMTLERVKKMEMKGRELDQLLEDFTTLDSFPRPGKVIKKVPNRHPSLATDLGTH